MEAAMEVKVQATEDGIPSDERTLEDKVPATATPNTQNQVSHKYWCDKCTGSRYFLSFKRLSFHLQEVHGNDKPSCEGARIPQFDLVELKDALERLSLTSVSLGEHLIVLNKNFDMIKDGEPYISFMFIYNIKSGQFLTRIWNQTMASGKVVDLEHFLQLCMIHFNQGKLCPGYIENLKHACNLLLPKDAEKGVELCLVCERVNEEKKINILQGLIVKEESENAELNVSDFSKIDECVKEEWSNEDDQEMVEVVPFKEEYTETYDEDPNFETTDYILQESEAKIESRNYEHSSEPDDTEEQTGSSLSSTRPKLSFRKLIHEALKERQMLTLSEIKDLVIKKYPYFGANEEGCKLTIRATLSKLACFERVPKNETTRGGLWRVKEIDESPQVKSGEGKIHSSLLQKSKDVPEKCEWCDTSLLRESKDGGRAMYIRHAKQKHFWGKFSCANCNHMAEFAGDLVQHIDSVGHEVHLTNCPSCHKKFHKNDIVSHYQNCIIDKKREKKRKKNLINAACHTCGKIFNNRKNYKHHILMHMRAKDAKEEDIAKAFPGTKNHSNLTLYHYCDKCDSKFTTHTNLQKHIKGKHEGKKFECDVCPATFSAHFHLNKHKIIEHSKDEKYACKHCGKRLRSITACKMHERKHEEPQFQCSICAKRLKTERNLLAHERMHTGEKPFPCSMCDSAFTCKSALGQHERGAHKIARRGGKTGWNYSKNKNMQGLQCDT